MTMTAGAREVVIAGELLVARADRTLFWPATGTLFVADSHLGKAETYRSLGVPVPGGTTGLTLDRLSTALMDTRATTLIVLGDLWHARAGRTCEALDALHQWRTFHRRIDVKLVLGNHDRRAGSLPENLEIPEMEEGGLVGPFSLCHHPCEADGYVLAGHVHPAVNLEGKGRQSMTLPCFWFGPRCGLLPAFGEFTGSARISPREGDCVLAIADDQVIQVTESLRTGNVGS